jgi:hypothetical protein
MRGEMGEFGMQFRAELFYELSNLISYVRDECVPLRSHGHSEL